MKIKLLPLLIGLGIIYLLPSCQQGKSKNLDSDSCTPESIEFKATLLKLKHEGNTTELALRPISNDSSMNNSIYICELSSTSTFGLSVQLKDITSLEYFLKDNPANQVQINGSYFPKCPSNYTAEKPIVIERIFHNGTLIFPANRLYASKLKEHGI